MSFGAKRLTTIPGMASPNAGCDYPSTGPVQLDPTAQIAFLSDTTTTRSFKSQTAIFRNSYGTVIVSDAPSNVVSSARTMS